MLEYKNVILVGYSGHGYIVADTALEAGLDLVYYAERKEMDLNPFGLIYLGCEGDSDFLGWNGNYSFIIGIGDNLIRKNIFNLILSNDKSVETVIHPSAAVSAYSKIGEGSFVGSNASINAMAKIGKYCILNTSCIIEHECNIGDGVHIAPGAVLAGNVKINRESFIGANSVIKQGIEIGSNVIIGAGTVVLNNISDNEVWVGNPARRIK